MIVLALLPGADARIFKKAMAQIPKNALVIADDRFADEIAPHLGSAQSEGPLVFVRSDLRHLRLSPRHELPGRGALFLLTEKPTERPDFMKSMEGEKDGTVALDDNVSLLRFKRPVVESPVTSLSGLVRSARTRIFDESGKEVAACAFSSGRCRYGERAWEEVKVSKERFSGQHKECLFIHPTQMGRLEVEIPDLPAGDALKIGFGLNDSAHGGDPALKVDVHINEIGVLSASPKKRGKWQEAIHTADPGKKTLRIRLSAPQITKRFFCLDPQVIRRVGESRQ
jgi:hypothetical protein